MMSATAIYYYYYRCCCCCCIHGNGSCAGWATCSDCIKGGWWASKLFCSPGVLLPLTCRSLYDIWLCWYWPSSRAVIDILWRLFPAKPLTFDNSFFAQRQWCEFSDQWMCLKARLAMKLSTHPGRMLEFSAEGIGASCWSKSCSWTLDICK